MCAENKLETCSIYSTGFFNSSLSSFNCLFFISFNIRSYNKNYDVCSSCISQLNVTPDWSFLRGQVFPTEILITLSSKEKKKTEQKIPVLFVQSQLKRFWSPFLLKPKSFYKKLFCSSENRLIQHFWNLSNDKIYFNDRHLRCILSQTNHPYTQKRKFRTSSYEKNLFVIV